MNHTPVAGMRCATCHETGKSFTGVTIVTRPTAAQDATHPKTGESGTAQVDRLVHHRVTGMPANHIPTTRRAAASRGRQHEAGGVMNDGGWDQRRLHDCHMAARAGNSFLGVTPLPQGTGHLPSGAIACESCHAATKVDKFGPNTQMNHPVVAGRHARTCHATREPGSRGRLR